MRSRIGSSRRVALSLDLSMRLTGNRTRREQSGKWIGEFHNCCKADALAKLSQGTACEVASKHLRRLLDHFRPCLPFTFWIIDFIHAAFRLVGIADLIGTQ